jgi:putative Mg2+ transporter-C (MgtC) family protein
VSEWDALLRIALALLLGSLIGIEREIRDKAAGFRTIMLVTSGSASFVALGLLLLEQYPRDIDGLTHDPTRILASIVAGIGFLGGAIVFRSKQRVVGVTTAAALWVATSIGAAAGAGYFIVALGLTVLTLVTLTAAHSIEEYLK